MGYERYDYGSSLPAADYPSIAVEEAHDLGANDSVTDESFAIPTSGLAELDAAPRSDLEIWTGASKTGTQFTIVENTPAAQYEVQVNWANGYLTFHSSDGGTTIYCTYTVSHTVITKRFFDKLQRNLVAMAAAITGGITVRLNSDVATGQCLHFVDAYGNTPVADIAKATSGWPPPLCMGLAGQSGSSGDTIGMLNSGVLMFGASSFPPGVAAVVGTDGYPSYEGKSKYPGEGQTLQVIGAGFGSSGIGIAISPQVGVI